MNSNIRSVCNDYIHNTKSTILNQRIPNQQIRIKQYRIMVSVKWGNWTLQLVICSIQFSIGLRTSCFSGLMSGHFDETLTHLSEEFVVDFMDLLQGTLPYFTRFTWLSVYFNVVYVTLVVFWFVQWTWDWVFCISSAERGNWQQNQVETKESSQTQAKLHLNCSYITPARPVSQSKAQWATQQCSRPA